MSAVAELWRRLRSLGRRAAIETRLQDEIRFHVEQQTEKNRRAGLSPDEARRLALVRFGGVQRIREQTRDEFRAVGLENLARDVRFGTRALLRTPGFTAVAVVTLALGIGAATAMFSVVNGILLQPLPYPDQDRLVETVMKVPAVPRDFSFASPAMYFGYRDHNRTFDAIGHFDWDNSPVTVTGGGEPESVPSLEVTREVLPILGATPAMGRSFTADDDRPGSAPTVIISHGYWQRRFGGANPLGQTLTVEGIPRQVIGVLPRSFRFFEDDADLFYPLQHVRAEARYPQGDGRSIARLKTGVTLEQANADVTRMIPLLWQEFNPNAANRQFFGVPRLRLVKDSVVGDLRETLWILMGTIGLLLLIACANVANLMLVRTQSRRAELLLRSALGAGLGAIARVVVTESAVLGFVGGVAGLGVAAASLPLLLWLGGDELPPIMEVTIDPAVLLMAAALAFIATVVFAGIPVLQLAARGLRQADALHGSRSVGDGREGQRTRQLLVVGQVAIALILLIGAGLMIRTFLELRRVSPGFKQPETVQTFRLTIPRTGPLGGDEGAANRERLLRTQQALLERLSAVGGVRSVGFSSGNDGLPLDGDGRRMVLTPYIDGREAAHGQSRTWEVQNVSPGFFETMQTAIIAGRSFTWDDAVNQRNVMLVSDSLARREFGSAAAALGRRVSASPSNPGREIVGVLEDVHHEGLDHPAPDTIVEPPRAVPTATFVVRSARAGDAAFLRELQRAIWAVNGELSLAGVQTLGDLYRGAMARASLTLLLLGITGTLAFVLGLIGIYGVVSYTVAQRRREIGVRLALGAQPGEILRLFVGHALVLVVAGVAIGIGASWPLTRLIASQLFGVSPLDPPTLLTMALGLVVAAALASYISARRGATMAPVDALKLG